MSHALTRQSRSPTGRACPVCLLAAVLLILSACQVAPVAPGERDARHIPPGSRLILERPIVIRREAVTAYLPRLATGPDSFWSRFYAAYCRIELWDKNYQEVTVEPDTFTITRAKSGITPILTEGRSPVQVATADVTGSFTLAGGDRGSSFVQSYAELYLHSPRQPNVYRVTCGYLDDPWKIEPLTIGEIRDALQGVFTLELAAAGQ